MKVTHIHTGHRARLKDKFDRVGLDGFQEHEVLEYLLTFAIPQRDVNPLAHHLIDHFGSLKGVLDASKEELLLIDGIGEHAAYLIRLLPPLARRYFDNIDSKEMPTMLRLENRKQFFIPKFIGETEECFYVAYLNNQRQVIHCQMMFRGSIDTVKVQIRSILDICTRMRATGVVLAHNHLSSPLFSVQDFALTDFIAECFEPLGIEVVDHLVICGNEANSMSAQGKIKHAR